MARQLMFIVIFSVSACISHQVTITNILTNEVPANVTVPPPTYPEVISEMYEPDRNKTNILEWLLGLAGIGTSTTPSPPIITDPTPTDCPACTCGITNKMNRIVGGEETISNEYPWMVLLKYRGQFYCGGSLICNKYVVTAAHCVSGFQKERITATFQVHDRNNLNDAKIFSRNIKYIIRHARYSNRNYDNDIALLKLDQPVPMEANMRPVCLPEKGKSFTGRQGVATGWGATSEGGSLASKLQEVTVDIMSNEDCKKTGYGQSRITDNMICAGYKEGKKDSCQGDSGGPLHIIDGTVHSLAGVVSWGDGCAQPNYPGVYSRVNRYLTWIRSNTQDCCYCNAAFIKSNLTGIEDDAVTESVIY